MAKTKYTRRGAPLSERLSVRYTISATGCWEWNAYLDHSGYGVINVDGKIIHAHRASYLTFVGKIPDGMMVLHRCDNPPCIRPDHLFIGTAADNKNDEIQKGRMPLGESRPISKLTADEVRAIRNDSGTNKAMAEKYGMSTGVICRIRQRKIWKHVK